MAPYNRSSRERVSLRRPAGCREDPTELSLTIELDDDLAQAVREAARREGIEMQALVREALRARIESPAASRADHEKTLLAAIAVGLPDVVWERYRALCDRRLAATLTADEQQELLGLTDQVESWYARRVALVTELASLRGEPFPELMKQLGLAVALDA